MKTSLVLNGKTGVIFNDRHAAPLNLVGDKTVKRCLKKSGVVLRRSLCIRALARARSSRCHKTNERMPLASGKCYSLTPFKINVNLTQQYKCRRVQVKIVVAVALAVISSRDMFGRLPGPVLGSPSFKERIEPIAHEGTAQIQDSLPTRFRPEHA